MQKKIPMDWQSIETVFLDLDGTLLDLHYDNYFWLQYMPLRYAEKYGVSKEQASEILLRHAKEIEGSLNWYCIDHWAENMGMDIVSLKHDVSSKIAVRSNVIPFLLFLRAAKKRIILLTNAHHKTLSVKFSYVDLTEYFDEIITSHSVGLAKEEKGFWEKLEQMHSFDKSSCLFVDDNHSVLGNARDYGISRLLCISQPDSQKQVEKLKDYLYIDDYQQLIDGS